MMTWYWYMMRFVRLLSQDIISSNIAICQKYGYAITGIKCSEAILESEDGFTSTTSIPRDKLIRTQTPQERPAWAI